MPLRAMVARSVLFVGCVVGTSFAAAADDRALELGFENVVRPFLKNHCLAATVPRSRRASST